MVFEYDHQTSQIRSEAYASLESDSSSTQNEQMDELTRVYLSACDSEIVCTSNSLPVLEYVSAMYQLSSSFFIQKKKKYKPVAQKVRPVITAVPPQFQINRKINGDPLAEMSPLNPNPPKFAPTGRYTQERKDAIDKIHSDRFLWDSERDLLHHFMSIQNQGFAWTDLERGRFRTDFFPPIEFPVIPHTPWVQKNILIPPGLYDEVCTVIQRKMDAGVYEPSNSAISIPMVLRRQEGQQESPNRP